MSDDPFLDLLNAKAGGGASAPVAPRAARNNNPGNLRWDGKSQWQGMTGVDPDGFVQFDSPASGQRALSINLGNQANLHGLNTVRGIISKYAPSNDGNNTAAYVDTVSKQLGVDPDQQIDPNDPRINQAMQAVITPVERGGGVPTAQPAPQQQAPDPYLAVLDGATKGGAVASGQADSSAGAGAVPVLDGANPVPGEEQAGWGDTLKSVGRGLAALTPTTDALVNGRNFADSLRDDATGAASGVAQIPASLIHLGAYGTALAGNKKSADTLHRWGDNVAGYFDTLAADKDSSAHGIAKLGSEITAVSPLAELTPLTDAARASKAGKLAKVLARYGDMAAQGGAAGAALSGGKDMGNAALEGAALAPAAGVAGDVLLPPVLKVAGAVGNKAKAMAQAIRKTVGAEAPAIDGAAVAQTIRKASELPSRTPDGRLIVDIDGGVPEAPIPPKSTTPEDMRAAMGSRGSNSGLEATTDLPANAAAHVDRLRLQGVPLDQALREAEVTHVGAKPTVAAVTRNPEDQAAIWEGAKQPTREGRALAAQIAQNNAAVVGRVQKMVQDAGGVPAQGEAAETAAQSLAKASDAERTRVSGLYKQAREAEGDQTVSVDALRELLATPQFKAPTDAASRELIGGMNTLVKEMGTTNGNRFSPDQVESLRQAANSAYDRMGGSVNDKIGAIKSALDESLDQLDKAGPAYKAARAAHKKWADAYENPKGISALIQRDAQGNFVNADNWRKAEGFVGSVADKPFIQVVNQLKANGDTAALNRMKASVLQRAYQRATNSQTDKLGNSMLNGKLFFAELNKIGTAKLQALFSPEELADIATTGRAAIHMNEAVPGTNNTSNTASALVKALENSGGKKASKLRSAARVAGHVTGAATGHFGGNVAVEGINHTIGAVTEHGRARQMAAALRESMNPAASRASAKAATDRVAAAMRRRSTARNIARQAPPLAVALRNHRKGQ